MENIFKKAAGGNIENSSLYSIYNLKENPFPSTPIVNQDNSDKRYNGDIYESSVREQEENQIETNFLKVLQKDPNHIRVGYILDTSYVGRGNGKSSFAVNLLKKINRNYCLDITNEQNKCFGLYIKPETSGRTRNFVNFLDLFADAIFNSKIIDYALASIRAEAIIETSKYNLSIEEFQSESNLIESLNNCDWFNQKKIFQGDIYKFILKNEYYNQISDSTPFRKKYWTDYSQTNTKVISTPDIQSYYKELRKDIDKINFIFNDLVNLFLASGFNGAYVIVDDFERIPDFQSDRQKRDFALEIRTNFFDGSSANSRLGFYNLILMLHAGVPRLIEKAWSESGMDQRSPISSQNSLSHIVYFNKLNKERAELLIKKYLSEFRIETEESISPFTREAIETIGEENEYNAAKILKLAYTLLDNGAKEKRNLIDKEYVNRILQKNEIEVDIATTIMDENSEDLQSKGNN